MNAVPEADERPPTLGELLSQAGLRLRERHLSAYAWAAAFTPVRERLERLDQSWADRFRRVDDGSIASLPRLHPPRPLPAPTDDPGRREPAPPAPPASAGQAPPLVATAAALPGAAPAPPTPGLPPDPAPTAPATPAAPGLPGDVRARLRDLAGPGAERMRVRTGPASDALARAHGADAVTLGTQVHLREGHYRPGTPGGFALLAHEARHVTALLGRGRAVDRATTAGPASEERAAREVEQRALASLPRPGFPAPARAGGLPPSVHRWSPGAEPPTGRGSPATPSAAARPMAAPVDRVPDPPAPAPGLDLEGLKRSLIEDIMRRLHSDFERGA